MEVIPVSRTFSNGVYSVTVNDDHSIRVRSGDWISKYSAAIYGDPKINWKRFKRKDKSGRFIDLVDPNKIVTGETLWHPDPLPGERPGRRPAAPIGVRPPESPVPPGEIDPYRVRQFFQLLKQWLCPVNDWTFETSAGVDLSASIFAGHYCAIKAQKTGDPEPTWFHAVGVGLGLGPEDFAGSISISPPDDTFWNPGFVGKFPTAGRTLSADEICGNYIVFDASAGFMIGGSFSLLLFGCNTPWHAILRSLVRFLRGEVDWLVIPWAFTGAVVMGGGNWSSPNLGISCKLGWMHRKECVTG
jgi:hypothetical protein